ncbi:MAG: prepilin-type N-terminal cleavage/methylation domain-containing protein [Heliobacteriaceae bacterium]|nr:prepilin-type N-terminal cleavage/methylation domain-containing protein [Heliobacteriaceae bacterium]
MTKRFGFTLAEVLITLGIIGVVAAMTMPTLLSSTQGAQYRTAYKKALSVLNQAVNMNIALDDYDFEYTTSTGTASTDASLYNIIKNHMNVMKVEDGTSIKDYKIQTAATPGATSLTTQDFGLNNYTFFFNDGIVFSFPKSHSGCVLSTTGTVNCKGLIDVNGPKNPNKQVTGENCGTDTSCIVKSPSDVYPVRLYGQNILPNSPAARAVLYGR